jgi:L-glyceraldehyde 3-phosphate reductase
MSYRRCGRSGLKLQAISLGPRHNFGDDRSWSTPRVICRRAFEAGINLWKAASDG